MNYAHNIIAKFGGVRALARTLQRAPSTVQGWKDRGSIPDEAKTIILGAAHKQGLQLSKDDFWPEPQEGASQ